MNRSKKYPLLLVFLLPLIPGCEKLNINSNCYNSLSSCYKPDKTAPKVDAYAAEPTPTAATVSVLTAIRVTFNEELKDMENVQKYAISNLSSTLAVSSVTKTGPKSVTVYLSGTLVTGQIVLSFPGLTDFGGNPVSNATPVTFQGSTTILVTIVNGAQIRYVSNGGGTGFANTTFQWSHDYATDPLNGNAYDMRINSSSCSDGTPLSSGTNYASTGPLAANTTVTTTLPATGFPGAGTYEVRICVANSAFNKEGNGIITITRDDTGPAILASLPATAYGAQKSIVFTCDDNCNNLAYTVASGSTTPTTPTAPTFNSSGVLLTGTAMPASWTTPHVSDPWVTVINVRAFDFAGNQTTTAFTYTIDTNIPDIVFLNSPPSTFPYVSATGAPGTNASTSIDWQGSKNGYYIVCRGVNPCNNAPTPTCGAGATLLTSISSYVANTVTTNTHLASSMATASGGLNTYHICARTATQFADVTYTIYRDDTVPTVASITPADSASGVLPVTSITVNLSESHALDATTITTNTGDTNCTGSIQLSTATNNFAAGTCIRMSAAPQLVSGTSYRITPATTLPPGLYKVRITNGLRDRAGNSLATVTQANGFTVIGLLRQFTFNNDSSDLVDQALSGFNLTTQGGPQKATGADGDANGAYQVAGATQYLTGADTQLPIGNGARTVCAWVKSQNSCSSNICMATMYGTTSNGPYLGIWNGRASYGAYGGLDYQGATTLPIETWVHLCSTYDSSTARIYVNGISDGSNASAWNTALGGGFAVGRQSGGINYTLDGIVDDVRVYSGALTVTDIRQIGVQVPNGLLAYFPFSDSASLTAIDYSGNGHTGTRNNGPSSTADRLGVGGSGAYNFSGSTQSITAPGANLPAGNAPRTLCSWMRPTALPPVGGFAIAAMYGTNATGQGNYIGLHHDGAQNVVIYSAWGDHVTFPHTAPLNTWLHLCGTYDGATAQIYLNGTAVTSMTKTWNTVQVSANGGIYIGKGDSSTSYPFTGAVDDVRIYNRVLTATEISTLAGQRGIGLVRQYMFRNGSLTNDAGSTTLTANGAPANITGHDGALNGAFTFNGSSQFLTVPDTGLPMGGLARTMCAWVYSSSATTASFIMGYGTATNSQSSFLATNTGNNVILGSFTTNLDVPSVYQVNTWQHICGIVDGSGNVTLYINGSIPAGGGPTPLAFATVSNGNLSIGARSDNNLGSLWNGRIDDVRIYNRALTQVELQQLQNE